MPNWKRDFSSTVAKNYSVISRENGELTPPVCAGDDEAERLLPEGMTKRELARRLNTSEDAVHYWLSGRTIGRKATVERRQDVQHDDPYSEILAVLAATSF